MSFSWARPSDMECGLCQSQQLELFYQDSKRQWDYFLCSQCDFVFRDPKTYLEAPEEERRYTTHNNSIENAGYVKFLSPNVETLLPYLNPQSRGLDFGSGPGPILDILFERKDIRVSNYDPYFANNKEVLNQQYDFVTCTEVFEHLYKPHQEMDIMTGLLKTKGLLLIMTEMRRDPEHFAGWGYRMDNTHVCFLNQKSLEWLARKWDYEILSSEGRISLLRKNS